MPDTALGTEDTEVNKTNPNPCPIKCDVTHCSEVSHNKNDK